MQHLGVVVARHDVQPIPTRTTTNMANLFLIALVDDLHHITALHNDNRPLKFILLTFGLAGSSVDINGFGDRQKGFFKYMLDHHA